MREKTPLMGVALVLAKLEPALPVMCWLRCPVTCWQRIAAYESFYSLSGNELRRNFDLSVTIATESENNFPISPQYIRRVSTSDTRKQLKTRE